MVVSYTSIEFAAKGVPKLRKQEQLEINNSLIFTAEGAEVYEHRGNIK